MAQILSQPVDFLSERMLAQRRRWGLLFAGSWLGLGLAVLALMMFKGPTILDWVLPVFYGNILVNLKLLLALKTPLIMLWQEYSWQLTGMAVIMVVVVREFWVNSPLPQPEEAEQGL